MKDILGVLPFLVFIALLWLVYVNVSFGAKIIRTKKQDNTLECCLSNTGKYFYLGLIALYVVAFVICMYIVIVDFTGGNLTDNFYLALNTITVISLVVSFLLQQIIYVGQKQMLIGKIALDYRKIKRVTYPKATKLRFTYGQKEYHTSLRFIDHSKLRKALQKTK